MKAAWVSVPLGAAFLWFAFGVKALAVLIVVSLLILAVSLWLADHDARREARWRG